MLVNLVKLDCQVYYCNCCLLVIACGWGRLHAVGHTSVWNSYSALLFSVAVHLLCVWRLPLTCGWMGNSMAGTCVFRMLCFIFVLALKTSEICNSAKSSKNSKSNLIQFIFDIFNSIFDNILDLSDRKN